MSSVPKNNEELQASIIVGFEKILADYLVIPFEILSEISIAGHVKGTKISVVDTISYLTGWGKRVLRCYYLKFNMLIFLKPDINGMSYGN